ncbi:hypothetical protein CCACVL1_19370 [Corchorus capsularis]|uniref:F-box domain-containing protein n=1 Tax=Corchorus capsularis TaxID=210143 RepID=A0A1R3HH83_COCAP|nr:hypothetical protein CCACVL1_19370 [Corchorus capsularis]
MEPITQRPKLSDDDVDAVAMDNRNKFSGLPDPVFHHILSSLETIDVIRASAVAKKWRHMWTSMPHLSFDYEADWLDPLRKEFSFTRVSEKYKDLINWVLLAHDKSVSIQSFRLSCLNNHDDHSVYRWINILTQKHVRELHLKVTSHTDKPCPFVLPRYLLVSDSLEVLGLDLQHSVLKIPSHVGFSRLKSLKLEHTQLLDQDFFHNFISSCPLLEILSLEGCLFQDFKVLDISCSNLKKLVFDNVGWGEPFDQGLSKCELKIACPNLVQFALFGALPQHLSWGKNPSFLKVASIFAFWGERNESDDVVLNEELVNYVFKILRELLAEPSKCNYISEIPDEAITCLTCHLKRVKLIDLQDDELEIVRFFLKNGHVLEKMSIIWYGGVQPKTQRAAIQKVMRFPRASSYVSVTFSEPKQVGYEELGMGGWLKPSRASFYERYKDLINWVLLTHDKSVSIQSFRLVCVNNDDDHSIYRWINTLAQKHVRELHLEVTSLTKTPFDLPRCLIASDSLEVLGLDLNQSVLKIPSHVAFSRLKSLKLVNANLWDQILFQNFISRCPLLETLILQGCLFRDFEVLDISLRNLRKLVIDNGCEGLFDQGLWECDLKIACPNLVQFELLGPLAKNIFWDKDPSFLQAAIIFAVSWEWNGSDDEVLHEEFADHMLKILRGVCHAEVLKLHMCILQHIYPAVGKPECFTTFYNLKALVSSIRLLKYHLQSLIYLMKCAPNLQCLSVLIDDEESARGSILEIPDEAIECLTCHLKRVKLIDIGCNNDELELIRFFLKNGHVLEEMSIIWLKHLEQESKRETIQEVMRFPRSSSCVTVTFSEPRQSGWKELGIFK